MTVTLGRMPETVDLLIYAGDLFRYSLVFTDAETGDPEDVSGYTFTSQVRLSQTDTGSPAATFGFDLSGAAVGVVTLQLLPAATTALLLPSEAKTTKTLTWDLQMTEIADTNNVRTPFAGSVTVTLDRTR